MSLLLGWCKPVISPSEPHIVVPRRGKLELHCRDNATASGAPSRLRWQRERARRLEGEVEDGGVAYVKVPAVQAYHMGRYVCVNNSTLEQSSIYVYVKGGCELAACDTANVICISISSRHHDTDTDMMPVQYPYNTHTIWIRYNTNTLFKSYIFVQKRELKTN